MCIQIVEVYTTCRCLYYTHAVDYCPLYRNLGHSVTVKIVPVGYQCQSHSSSSVYQSEHLIPRRGQASDSPATEHLSPRFPAHSTPQSRNDNIEVVDVQGPHREQYHYNAEDFNGLPGRDRASNPEFVNEIRSASLYLKRLLHVLQPDPLNLDRFPTLELLPLQVLAGAQISGHATQSSTSTWEGNHAILAQEPEASPAPSNGPTTHQSFLRVRPCYLLLALGVLTVVGSLAPALWQAKYRHDMSGVFSLAQYILGIGVFVVGGVTAIHCRSCTCWQNRQPKHLGVDTNC